MLLILLCHLLCRKSRELPSPISTIPQPRIHTAEPCGVGVTKNTIHGLLCKSTNRGTDNPNRKRNWVCLLWGEGLGCRRLGAFRICTWICMEEGHPGNISETPRHARGASGVGIQRWIQDSTSGATKHLLNVICFVIRRAILSFN